MEVVRKQVTIESNRGVYWYDLSNESIKGGEWCFELHDEYPDSPTPKFPDPDFPGKSWFFRKLNMDYVGPTQGTDIEYQYYHPGEVYKVIDSNDPKFTGEKSIYKLLDSKLRSATKKDRSKIQRVHKMLSEDTEMLRRHKSERLYKILLSFYYNHIDSEIDNFDDKILIDYLRNNAHAKLMDVMREDNISVEPGEGYKKIKEELGEVKGQLSIITKGLGRLIKEKGKVINDNCSISTHLPDGVIDTLSKDQAYAMGVKLERLILKQDLEEIFNQIKGK